MSHILSASGNRAAGGTGHSSQSMPKLHYVVNESNVHVPLTRDHLNSKQVGFDRLSRTTTATTTTAPSFKSFRSGVFVLSC